MADINNPIRPEEEEYIDDIPFNTADVFSEYFADKTDANIMKTPKYLKGFDEYVMPMNNEQQTRVQLRKEVIDDNFIQTQTVVDYDTEHFKYTDFNDPMFMYQDPLFPTFDIILDTTYSPLLTTRNDISSLRRFLVDYVDLPGIQARQQIYTQFEKTLYTLFNDDFKKINRNKSYYINSINGLDKMTAKIVDFEKEKITITLNDDVSMITTYLAQLYNNLAYSYKDQRYMFPANLLRFNMYIKIHDIRNMINRVPKYKPNDTATSGDMYTTSFDKSYQIYYLQDCTFDFFKSKTFDDNITVGGFDASLSNRAGAITLEITYKSITIESGFPLIKNNISDLDSSALTLQNKATSLKADFSNNMVYINNEKSVDAFNDEIETLKKPDINSNKPYVQPSYDNTNINTINSTNRLKKTERENNMKAYRIYNKSNINGNGDEISGDVISSPGIDPQWKSPNDSDTVPEIIQNYREIRLDPVNGGRPFQGDVISSPGIDPQWKSPNDSDTVPLITQDYREVRLDPFNGGRPFQGDVQVNGPGSIPMWQFSDTSAPEIYAMKQSILNQLNFIGFIHTLPLSVIKFFMGGYHGMVEGMYIQGSGSDVIYAPRGAQDYSGGNVIYPPELDGDIVPNMGASFGLNRLDDEFIPEYPEGQLPDPNILNGEAIETNTTISDELEGEIIPGSIIQPGGVFSDPTLLDGENLNFQIPLDLLLETIYIPMMWHVNAPLEGSISMDWHPKDPLDGVISTEFQEKDPLEGVISTEFQEKDPLEGVIEMSFNVKDPLEGFINMLIYDRDPLEGVMEYDIKPRVDLEGRISQEIKERDPLDIRIDNSYRQRDFLDLIKPVYNIPIKAPLSHYVDTSTREKPEFEEVILYTYPEFERKVELGTLYLNITEENLMPIVYLYSKVDEFKSLVDYYVYNRVTSEVKQPSVTIDQTSREAVPLNLIYSYNNTIDVAKTMQLVFAYDNEVNKVNNMIATYVFGEYPVKEELTEIKLYNNSVLPILMPYIYLYEPSEKETSFEAEERVYQMEINQFGNNLPNGLSIDATIEKNKYPIQLGSIVDNNVSRKEFTLPKLYEPSKIKKLLEPQLLYEPVERSLFETSIVYDGSEAIVKNIFEPNYKIEETQFQEFGNRLNNVNINSEIIVLKNFPYTTMSYVPLYEIEKDITRDKILDKERLEFMKLYKKPLSDEYIAFKPILDKDSELSIKLEGDRIDTEQRKRTNKEEYEYNISALSDLDRIIEKKGVDPPRKNPDGVEVDQTLTFKTPFKENYVYGHEDNLVIEKEEKLNGERVDLGPRELVIERLGNVLDNDIELRDREYLSEEAIDYNLKPRRNLVVENIDSETKKKKNLDGESID